MLQLYKCIYRTAEATDKERRRCTERGRLLLTREHLKKKKHLKIYLSLI